jgi:UTP--glucose-1-phosphate uridylyltransferase
MKVIIPAAGLGSRFSGHGFGVPKELLKLGGKPVIAHALDEAARSGFEGAVVVLSPAKWQVNEFLADCELPLPVEIVIQPQPSGVGAAVVLAWPGEPAGVLLPDDVVLEGQHWNDLVRLHHATGAATLCVRRVPIETTGRFGIADCIGDRVIRLTEKPPSGTSASNLAIFGRYVVTEGVVAALDASQVSGELELTFGYSAVLKTSPGVRAVRFDGEVYDCGTPDEYVSSMARFANLP